ncbi:unnamed protein product, partial [Discosporangium mesarthrocarpum]
MALQRGRDHGIPSYNEAREAFGLPRASAFADITSNLAAQRLLSNAYGGELDMLDAFTGALAEGKM